MADLTFILRPFDLGLICNLDSRKGHLYMSIVLYHLTNIYKIYVYCWKLSNLFVQALKTSRKASLCHLALSRFLRVLQRVWINAILPTMYEYSVNLAMLKNTNRLPNFTEKSKNNRSKHFQGCPFSCPFYSCWPSLYMNQVPDNRIKWRRRLFDPCISIENHILHDCRKIRNKRTLGYIIW